MEVSVLTAQEGNAGINSSEVYQVGPVLGMWGGQSDLDMSPMELTPLSHQPCECETWLQGVERSVRMRIYWVT